MRMIKVLAVTAFLSICFLGTLNNATKTAQFLQPKTAAPSAMLAKRLPVVPDCLPNGNGGPCLPFSTIDKMMQDSPDPERSPKPIKGVTKI
jgi:hypothetical protein